MIVLDTNIVLDLFVFDEPAVLPLKDALQTRQLQWIATPAMREELARVLAYKQIVPRLAYYQRSAADVLADFDRLVKVMDAAPKAPVTCKDADDQQFIDLAVARKTPLLSKDHAVLCMKKRLLALDVQAQTAIEFVASMAAEAAPETVA
jgi:putative PIN family toxin of toxin-antitoxin system